MTDIDDISDLYEDDWWVKGRLYKINTYFIYGMPLGERDVPYLSMCQGDVVLFLGYKLCFAFSEPTTRGVPHILDNKDLLSTNFYRDKWYEFYFLRNEKIVKSTFDTINVMKTYFIPVVSQ